MELNLTVTPATSYIRIKPGSVVSHTVTLENNALEPLTVSPKILDFSSDGKSGIPVLSSSTAFPYLDIKSIESQTITLPPQKRAQLTLRFQIPENAEEKEFPLTLLFKSTALPAPNSESSSNLTGAIGSNIIVLISQDEQLTKTIEVADHGVPKIVDSYDTLTLTPMVKNTNFAATTMAGKIVVTNMWGKEVVAFPIFPDTILGYSTRELRAMRTFFQPDIDPEAVPFAYKKNSIMLGPHTVTISLTQPYTSENAGEIVATRSVAFFALPIIPTLALLGIVFSLVMFYFANKNAKKVDK